MASASPVSPGLVDQVGAVLALLSIIVQVLMVVPRRRELLFGITARRALAGEFWQRVPDPHLVQVTLAGRGRHDISSTDFDGGQPLVLALDTPVLDTPVLDHTVESDPSFRPAPPVTTTGEGQIHVGPGLVARGQIVHIRLATRGRPEHIRVESSPMKNVNVRWESPERRRPLRWLVVVATYGLVAAMTSRAYSLLDDAGGLGRYLFPAWLVVATAEGFLALTLLQRRPAGFGHRA